jgi:hypothetical protein
VIFLAGEEDERQVRELITQALAGGQCVGPDGKASRWNATESHAGALSEADEALGVDLARQ